MIGSKYAVGDLVTYDNVETVYEIIEITPKLNNSGFIYKIKNTYKIGWYDAGKKLKNILEVLILG